MPSGWQPDDVLVMIAHRSDNTAMTALSGWTQISSLSGNNTTGQRVEIWMRRAVAGDPSSVTVTFGGGTVLRGGRIYGIRGCPTTGAVETTIDVSARQDNATPSLNIGLPSITTTGINRFSFTFAELEDQAGVIGLPSGYVNPAEGQAATATGTGAMLGGWYREVRTAQTIATDSVAASGSGVAPA